jgi:processive 1,2-diacylglycerol beta-glucosyltransferase
LQFSREKAIKTNILSEYEIITMGKKNKKDKDKKKKKKKSMKKQVLIVSASAGSGHTTSANALAEAFEEMHSDEIDVKHIDLLDYSTSLMRAIFKNLYLYLAKKRPLTYGFIYKYTDYKARNSNVNVWLNTKKFRKFLKKNDYDFIISTHFASPHIIARMKKKSKFSVPHMTVLTDFGAHHIWGTDNDYYIVPDELNKVYFEHKGYAKEGVYDLGIPIKTVFSKNKPRDELRKKYELDDTKKTILLLSGGFGVGPILDIIKNLENVKTPHETVVICGKSKELYDDCIKLKEKLNYNLIPVGYTNDMDEYMKASDVVITKPGGLTTAEALASKLPIIIVNPIIGQEDKNADTLLEKGCAVKVPYLSVIHYNVDALINDDKKLNEMKANIGKIARPRAAYDITKFVKDKLLPPVKD